MTYEPLMLPIHHPLPPFDDVRQGWSLSKIFVLASSEGQYRAFHQRLRQTHPQELSRLLESIDGHTLHRVAGHARDYTGLMLLPNWHRRLRWLNRELALLLASIQHYFTEDWQPLTFEAPQPEYCPCRALCVSVAPDPVSGNMLVWDITPRGGVVTITSHGRGRRVQCTVCGGGYLLEGHVVMDVLRPRSVPVTRRPDHQTDALGYWGDLGPDQTNAYEAILELLVRNQRVWEAEVMGSFEPSQRPCKSLTVPEVAERQRQIVRQLSRAGLTEESIERSTPVEPLPPLGDLDEGLQCCHETFPTHKAYMAHRRTAHARLEHDGESFQQ